MLIAIVDLGIGNLRSVEQAFNRVDTAIDVVVTADAKLIDSADKIVLPGQGAIDTWFQALDDRELRSPLARALTEKPVLGICVGMQALFSYCEEGGGMSGLGMFDGSVRHFNHFHNTSSETLKIPQMGWNQVAQVNSHSLWKHIDDQTHFYFVHSYCANLHDENLSDVFGMTNYGHDFVAAIGRDNVFAVQFHPEKSHRDGLQLLTNFSQWDGN
jgi:glutamine amidotransferase